MTNIIIFNTDLRIKDNPAFAAALKNSKKILPIFILDEVNRRPVGAASKWFLHHALLALRDELQKKYQLKLILKKGNSLKILAEIFSKEKIEGVYFNRECEPYNIKLHAEIKKLAQKNSGEVFDFKAQTLFDFDEIKTGQGTPFKVFTPFFKECKKHFSKIEKLIPEPSRCCFEQPHNHPHSYPEPHLHSHPELVEGCGRTPEFKHTLRQAQGDTEVVRGDIDDLDLLPKINWTKNFVVDFDYKKIEKNLDEFFAKKIFKYKEERNILSADGNSHLSSYLAWGMISVREVFWKIQNISTDFNENIEQFLAEIFWREFCHHLIFHFPEIVDEPFNKKFKSFPWQENKVLLRKWQKGETGFPIVDAAMNELWQTGLMHNRARMIVASFLTKDLLLHWKDGEAWFWDCLLDANLANNVANWQWVAGCGADAAPYFRIFNPNLQAERFDPDENYVKKWLKKRVDPIIDHNEARKLALMLYKNL